uniref:Olfactory receptor n=1 Tax=Xenopus tropicalis TaxID=8364 RepID=A0A6I8STC3_XENTR
MKIIDVHNATGFILAGFSSHPQLQHVLFLVFLLIYVLTVTENIIIIGIVKYHPKLHKPMYYLLSTLLISDFSESGPLYVTVTMPKLLSILVAQNKQISFVACITQLYVFISLACTECMLLAGMAFDRYVAICIPLRYPVIMNNSLCLYIVIGCWACGFSIAMLKVGFISRLTFCGDFINHFFCDISPLLNLACKDMSLPELVDFILAIMVSTVPLIMIIVSYLFILQAILKIPSNLGKINTFDKNKLVSIFYSIFTPMLNPVIYCLRNREVKEVLRKTFG